MHYPKAIHLEKASVQTVATMAMLLLWAVGPVHVSAQSPASTSATVSYVPVTISGGREIGRQDFGRPVPLIAAGLGIAPEVFRAAFSKVRPARGGTEPAPAQVRQNKDALMAVLAPHGVTNEQLDTVSNYYRFNPKRGETWPARPAKATALVRDGAVYAFTIQDAGSGYSSPPKVVVPGHLQTNAVAELHFGKDLSKNGSVARITLLP